MESTASSTRGPLLSRAALVAVTRRGPVLPRTTRHRRHELDAADLALLVALADATAPRAADDVVAEVAAATGGDADRLRATVDELQARGALGEFPASRPAPWSDDVVADGDDVPTPADLRVQLLTPLTIAPTPDGYRWFGHDGELVAVTDPVVTARLCRLVVPGTIGDQVADDPPERREAVRTVAGALRRGGLLVPEGVVRSSGPHLEAERIRYQDVGRWQRLTRAVEAHEEERSEPRGVRTAVLPVQSPPQHLNLALGQIMAYAQVWEGGRLAERYDLDPLWLIRPRTIAGVLDRTGPAVILLSDYLWSADRNFQTSRIAKEHSPSSLVVHGGPELPKHPDALRRWLDRHPYIDVVVHGEGEQAAVELLAAVDGDPGVDRAALRDVAGITYRDGDQVVRTADRERMSDLTVLPSPYLTGIFDAYGEASAEWMTIESNRGCPYGCTFCDWGQATLSRIRRYPLERTLAEIEWGARNGIPSINVADANFGIFKEDLQIAEHVAACHREHGFPLEFGVAQAKNTTKYTLPITGTLDEAGVKHVVGLSLQSFDQPTLDAVERSNIRTQLYTGLFEDLQERSMASVTELMVGLPGSTPDSFARDLQRCVELEVTTRIHRTVLLVNSPMNDPAYRERWQIRTELDPPGPGTPEEWRDPSDRSAIVRSTASYTEEQRDEMFVLADLYRIFEYLGVLRHVLRYVRHETGIEEVALLRRMAVLVPEQPERWPLLGWTLATMTEHSAVPLRWQSLLDEVRDLVVELGTPDDAALDVVLAVQAAHLPARDRAFPAHLELDHDYATWHADLLRLRRADPDGWRSALPPLRSLGPGSITVTDPADVCSSGLGLVHRGESMGHWELRSEVSRSMLSWVGGTLSAGAMR